MCGIIYARTKRDKSVNNEVIKQYLKQRPRGHEGFGIYDFKYKNLIKQPSEGKILKYLRSHPTDEMLFHHRFPTSTGNVKNACHPFSTKDYFGDTQYIMIHNGVLSNSRELASSHTNMGIEYSSVQQDGRFNDSEALMWDLALVLEGKQAEPKARGSVAIIMLEKHKDASKNKLHWFHNSGNPLFIRDNAKKFVLSSEGGPGSQAVEINNMFSYSYETEEVDKTHMWLSSSYYTPSNVNNASYPLPYQDFDEETYRRLDDDLSVNNQLSLLEEDEIQSALADEFDEQEEQQWKLLSDSKKFSKKLKSRVKEFMAYADGNYSGAVFLLENNLKDLAERPYSLETWYEMQQLGGAMAILLADPFWDSEDQSTVHPLYQEDESSVKGWDGSIVAVVQHPPTILEQTKTDKGIEHISKVIARNAVIHVQEKIRAGGTKVGDTPDLIARIPVYSS